MTFPLTPVSWGCQLPHADTDAVWCDDIGMCCCVSSCYTLIIVQNQCKTMIITVTSSHLTGCLWYRRLSAVTACTCVWTGDTYSSGNLHKGGLSTCVYLSVDRFFCGNGARCSHQTLQVCVWDQTEGWKMDGTILDPRLLVPGQNSLLSIVVVNPCLSLLDPRMYFAATSEFTDRWILLKWVDFNMKCPCFSFWPCAFL